MIKNKSIKFKIELTSKNSSREDISTIYDQITILIDSISERLEDFDIRTNIITDNILTKYTGTYLDSDEPSETIKDRMGSFKEKFYDEDQFDKYINTLPRYDRKPPSKSLNYIRDFLIKNRSAKMKDIVNGCFEQGFPTKSKKPTPQFYLMLQKLVQCGEVTKKDNIYFWNYDSDQNRED